MKRAFFSRGQVWHPACVPPKVSGAGKAAITGSAVPPSGDPGQRNVDGDDVIPTSVVSVSTFYFYGDLSTPELDAELVRLGQIMENRGLLA